MIGVQFGRVIVAGRPVRASGNFVAVMIWVAYVIVVCLFLAAWAILVLAYRGLRALWRANHRRRVRKAFLRPPSGPCVVL